MRPSLRVVRTLAAVVASLGALSTPSIARAGSMDPTPERLILQPPGMPAGMSCRDVALNPGAVFQAPFPPGATPSNYGCLPDNVAFRNLASELGFAIAPTAFHPARTTGLGGFAITLEASYTHINADDVSRASDGTLVQYWHQGTRGAVDPNTKLNSIVNNGPDSLLQVYSLKARKGLPLGFEITGAFGYLANTTLWVGGADVRWSVLEGFRTGALGWTPDISVGSGVRTLIGSSKLYLTTVGIDVEVSKPITVASAAVLTPYVGYQRLIIFGNSGVVDTTPNVDPLQQCGSSARNPSGEPDCKPIPGTNTPNKGDFNNNVTFDPVRTHRHRGIVGVNYRYDILYLAGQLIVDLTPPNDENPGLSSTRQWTMSLEGGVFF